MKKYFGIEMDIKEIFRKGCNVELLFNKSETKIVAVRPTLKDACDYNVIPFIGCCVDCDIYIEVMIDEIVKDMKNTCYEFEMSDYAQDLYHMHSYMEFKACVIRNGKIIDFATEEYRVLDTAKEGDKIFRLNDLYEKSVYEQYYGELDMTKEVEIELYCGSLRSHIDSVAIKDHRIVKTFLTSDSAEYFIKDNMGAEILFIDDDVRAGKKTIKRLLMEVN